MNKQGFTLIELLVVIAIVSLLAALLFPVFVSVRAKGRQAACESNLHQLGLAVAVYAQDSDDGFPYGGDPTDLQTDSWQTAANGQFWPQAHEMPRLQDVLKPYVTSPEVWHCPSDTGFDEPAFSDGDLSALPSEYEQYGISYAYRTELSLRGKSLDTVAAYENFPPYTEHGPSDINLLCDQSDYWHGSVGSGRVNTLMIDGHVQSMTYPRIQQAWHLVLDPPTP
jgi:prepilin-type N-terminal cleavage/methylation domain-containing protein/prepilin-type processing-associated H-X9-DG protein